MFSSTSLCSTRYLRKKKPTLIYSFHHQNFSNQTLTQSYGSNTLESEGVLIKSQLKSMTQASVAVVFLFLLPSEEAQRPNQGLQTYLPASAADFLLLLWGINHSGTWCFQKRITTRVVVRVTASVTASSPYTTTSMLIRRGALFLLHHSNLLKTVFVF